MYQIPYNIWDQVLVADKSFELDRNIQFKVDEKIETGATNTIWDTLEVINLDFVGVVKINVNNVMGERNENES